MDLFRTAAEWQRPMQRQALMDFDALWEQSREWVEEPNLRWGGWSGVTRLTLIDGQGGERIAYLKRQEGQLRRTLSSWGRARPSYFREFVALVKLQSLGVPVVEWVCYGERDGRALLLTLEPRGFISLADLAALGDARLLDQALAATVTALGTLHRHRWQHGSCYPAHVLIHPRTLEVRLLDLERARRLRGATAAAYADLRQLIRRCSFINADQVERMVAVASRYAPGMDGSVFSGLSA